MFPDGTPPKFNSSPLKNGGWKAIGKVTFQGRTVKLQGGRYYQKHVKSHSAKFGKLVPNGPDSVGR